MIPSIEFEFISLIAVNLTTLVKVTASDLSVASLVSNDYVIYITYSNVCLLVEIIFFQILVTKKNRGKFTG
jgi:hypothetical protein